MAFNPFNWFRKHQKVIFAALTIMCMIVFIFQFGAGDPFTKAAQWFGAGRAAGDYVTTMYDKKLYEGDLGRLERQRKMANDFMFVAVLNGQAKAQKAILENLKNLGTDSSLAGLDRVVQEIPNRMNALQSNPQLADRFAEFYRAAIREDFSRLEEIASRDGVKDNADRMALVQRVTRLLGFQRWRLFEPFPPGQRQKLYFGASLSLEDRLDFRLWEHQANRLGVKLTDEDLKKEIVAEAAGGEVFEGNADFLNDPLVKAFLSNNREYTNVQARELLEALRTEFRVVMAQGIMLGNEPGVRGYRAQLGTATSPAVATPVEFLQYVREQRANLRVQMLTIPVANYLAKVDANPPEEELRQRYDTYKDKEPFPWSREPGFKESRRVAIEYAWASPQDPYYRDLVRMKIYGWPATAALAGTPLGALTAIYADPIRAAYVNEIKNEPGWFDDSRDIAPSHKYRYHFTSAMQPVGLTSMFGSLTTGSPLNAAFSVTLNSVAAEARMSLQFNLTQLLAQADPRQALAAAMLLAVAQPPPPSEALLQPQLIAAMQDRLTENELRDNITKIIQEVAKLRGRRDAAKDYLAKAVKDYHLQTAKTPGPRTLFDLVDALKKKENIGLAGLRDALATLYEMRGERVDLSFVATLFQTVGAYEPRDEGPVGPRKEQYVWWRSEDLPARNRPYNAVVDQVKLAWQLEKARQLARAEAERLEKHINDEKLNAALAEKVLKEQKQGTMFELDNVAQLNPPREVLAGRPTEYRPYTVPEEKLASMEYPPNDLAKQLMALQRPGEATVVVDQPGKNFYVAVLVERSEPSIADFVAIYARTPGNDTLYRRFLDQRREDFRKTVLEQLRREAVKKGGELDKDGRFKIPEAIRLREGGPRGSDDE